MKRLILWAALAAFCLSTAGCLGPIVRPVAMMPPTVTPPACNALETLRKVDALLAGSTFEAHYLTISGKLTLSIWLVDPALDPYATESNLAENNLRALERGLSISYRVLEQVPCVRKLFENINPMIMDRNYQSWYLDILPIRIFPESQDLSDEKLLAVIRGSDSDWFPTRRYAPAPAYQPAPADACSWPAARAAIQQHFGAERRNAAAYLLVQGDPPAQSMQDIHSGYNARNVVVQAQWNVRDATETEDAAILGNLDALAQALTCLSPPIDLLEVFVVDENGQLVAYCLVPGALIRERNIPLPAGRVLLHHTVPARMP